MAEMEPPPESTSDGAEAPEQAGRELRDGREEGLEPLAALDPESTESCSQLLEAMSRPAERTSSPWRGATVSPGPGWTRCSSWWASVLSGVDASGRTRSG